MTISIRNIVAGLMLLGALWSAYSVGRGLQRAECLELTLKRTQDDLKTTKEGAAAVSEQRDRVDDAVAAGQKSADSRDRIVERVIKYVPTETDECKAARQLLAEYRAARLLNSAPGTPNHPALPPLGANPGAPLVPARPPTVIVVPDRRDSGAGPRY